MALALCSFSVAADDRPNILWLDIDDQSPWYGAYGDETVATPHIDALAEHGVLFERAYVAVPVCAPSRSAMVTGAYPIRLGTHDMRSGRVPGYQIHLPEDVTTVPELIRRSGYETYNASKDDYNFTYKRTDLYSLGNVVVNSPGSSPESTNWKGLHGKGHWREVSEGVPFFGQTSIPGGKSVTTIQQELRSLGLQPVDPTKVRVPEQYPDIPQVRRHVADHYNSIIRTDHRVGEITQALKEDGLWGNTIIILYSDHGSDLPRSKEFVYEEGLHIPLIVAAPGLRHLITPGRRNDLVSLMDIAATTLALAGVEVPENMDAKDIFAEDYRREYVYSSADRMSNVIDRTRSIMGKRYHYIRNFMLDRPLYNWGHRELAAHMSDPNGKTTSFMALRRLAEAGELHGTHAAPYGKRIAEELYDLKSDPDETINLASNPAYVAELEKMRALLRAWLEETDDKGQYPRSEAALAEVLERFPPEWLQSPELRSKSRFVPKSVGKPGAKIN